LDAFSTKLNAACVSFAASSVETPVEEALVFNQYNSCYTVSLEAKASLPIKNPFSPKMNFVLSSWFI
jgi:hypothetical protein